MKRVQRMEMRGIILIQKGVDEGESGSNLVKQ